MMSKSESAKTDRTQIYLRIIYDCVFEHRNEQTEGLSTERIDRYLVNPRLRGRNSVQYSNPDNQKTFLTFEKISDKFKNGGYHKIESLVSDIRSIIDHITTVNRSGAAISKEANSIKNALEAQLKECNEISEDSDDNSNKCDLNTVKSRLVQMLKTKLPAIKIPSTIYQTKNIVDAMDFLTQSMAKIVTDPNEQFAKLSALVSVYDKIRTVEKIDVKAEVKKIIGKVFDKIYNSTDESGRFFADTIMDIAKNTACLPVFDREAPSFQSLARMVEENIFDSLSDFQEHLICSMEGTKLLCGIEYCQHQDALWLMRAFSTTRIRETHELLESSSNVNFTSMSLLEHTIKSAEIMTKKLSCEKNIKNRKFIMETDNVKFYMLHSGDIVIKQENCFVFDLKFIRPRKTKHSSHHRFLANEVFLVREKVTFQEEDISRECRVLFWPLYVAYEICDCLDLEQFYCESSYDPNSTRFETILHWRCGNLDSAYLKSPDCPYQPRIVQIEAIRNPLHGEPADPTKIVPSVIPKQLKMNQIRGLKPQQVYGEDCYAIIQSDAYPQLRFQVQQGAVFLSTARKMNLKVPDQIIGENRLEDIEMRFALRITQLRRKTPDSEIIITGILFFDPSLIPGCKQMIWLTNELIEHNNSLRTITDNADGGVAPCSIEHLKRFLNYKNVQYMESTFVCRYKYDEKQQTFRTARKIQPGMSSLFETEYYRLKQPKMPKFRVLFPVGSCSSSICPTIFSEQQPEKNISSGARQIVKRPYNSDICIAPAPTIFKMPGEMQIIRRMSSLAAMAPAQPSSSAAASSSASLPAMEFEHLKKVEDLPTGTQIHLTHPNGQTQIFTLRRFTEPKIIYKYIGKDENGDLDPSEIKKFAFGDSTNARKRNLSDNEPNSQMALCTGTYYVEPKKMKSNEITEIEFEAKSIMEVMITSVEMQAFYAQKRWLRRWPTKKSD